jgi:parvulin-like peptidyl-prolyl isomerase
MGWTAASASGQEPPDGTKIDGVVAIVGDKVVTRSDLAAAMEFQVALLNARQAGGMDANEVQQEFRELQTEIRDNLVNNTLILLEAEEEGLSVDDQVNRQAGKLRQAMAENPAEMSAFLRARGYGSLDEYLTAMREEVLRQRIVMLRVRARSEITDEELEAAFSKRYGPTAGSRCKGARLISNSVSQIWFPLLAEASMERVLEIYAQAYRCYKALEGGGFAAEDVAQKCSTSELRPDFGSVGELDETHAFEAAFQEAFDQLLESSIARPVSQPVMGQDGVRILMVTDRQEVCVTDADDVARMRTALKVRLEDRKFQKAMKFWLEELRGKYQVQIRPL